MNTGVGLLNGNLTGWELLLRQEGIAWSVISGSGETVPLLIACGQGDNRTIDIVKTHCRGGGALLCSGSVYASLLGSSPKRRSVSYLIDQDSSPFGGLGILDVYSMGERIPGANQVYDRVGAPSVFVGSWNDSPVIVLPFDPGNLVLDPRSSTKSFYSPAGRLPFERVSLVAKGTLRKLVARSIEHLCHRLDIPYIHTWYYPSGDRTRCSFRIDTDGAGPDDLKMLYEVLEEYSIPGSWFLDTGSQKEHLAFFRSMKNQEIGVHGHQHAVFHESERTLGNFRQALSILRDAGFDPRGAAAPFGRWNAGIRRSFGTIGFEYSSEFSYDYDNLPSIPGADVDGYHTLQIPVHPVSIGSLKRQGFGEKEMSEYIEAYVLRQVPDGEPVMIYHHPRNGHEAVLRSYFALCAREGISTWPMLTYSRWWGKRWAFFPRFGIDGQTLKMNCTGAPEELYIHLTRNDGTECRIPARDVIELTDLPWNMRPAKPLLPTDIRRIRRFNPWIPLVRIEDHVVRWLKG